VKGGIEAWKGRKATGTYEAGMYLIEGRKTAEEFIALAWSLEEGTRKFYQNVKDIVADDETKGVFDSLVKAEEKHKETLVQEYSHIKGTNIEGGKHGEEKLSGTIEGGLSIDEAMAWLHEDKRELSDMLEFSIQLETNSLDLYLKILHKLENKDTQKIFGILAEEEKKHLSRLGNLLNSKYNVI
jgi:rubrerythrin